MTRPPTILGVNIAYVSLVTMIVQTTFLVLTLRYSRTASTDGPRYISSTAVVMSEIVKTVTALVVMFVQSERSVGLLVKQIDTHCISRWRDFAKVSVPAVLYVVQNNLLFVALSKLDAATYQVTYQLKILTTAIFSVTMLQRQLNMRKWIALFILMGGVALVQWPSDNGSSTKASTQEGASNQMVGLAAVIGACFTSGFSGVYMEKILKQSPVSLWMRNFQLAFFSIFCGLFTVYINDGAKVAEGGFLQGYNPLIWSVVLQQAYGGLVIAVVVKYADNIMKGFATSLSIILSSVTSYVLLDDLSLTMTFMLGTSFVISSVFVFGYEPKAEPVTTAAKI